MIKVKWKRAAALAMAGIMCLTVAGCGKKDDTASDPAQTQGTNGYVYVPEYMELGGELGENANISSIMVGGEYIYYSINQWNEESGESSQDFYRRKVAADGVQEALPLKLETNQNVNNLQVDQEGNLYLALADYSNEKQSPEGYMVADYFLQKFDSQGNQVFSQDISELMNKDQENNYIQNIQVDSEGRLYLASSQLIRLFDAQGAFQGEIPTTDWIQGLVKGKEGKIYLSQYGQTGQELKEIDFTAKTIGSSYQNFPSSNGNATVCPGIEKDFLVSDSSKLYEYDMNTQSSTEVLDWLDSDINGQYIQAVSTTSEGKLVVVISDWSQGTTTNELVLLTKTKADQVSQKQVITIGSLYVDQMLQNSAVAFNKSNETYRIKIKNYVDNNIAWTENTYSDAMTAMNNDITSGSGPDIFNMSYDSDYKGYVAKGIIEDLNPYLEKSTLLKKDSFLPEILNAYTIDGVLTCIPSSFSVQTIFGKTSQVGDKMGWSFDDMLAFIDQNPDTEVFEYATNMQMLSYCLMGNQDSFLDAGAGTCSFDSPEFKKVLEFAARFPKEFAENSETALPFRLQAGEVLLNTISIYGMEELQMNLAMFGEPVTAIGYPTTDGTPGNMLMPGGGSYAISSKSKVKDGAWTFVEFVLANQKSDDRFSYGLPTRSDLLEEVFAKSMKEEYVTDENGDPVLDENGEPMIQPKGSWGYNGWDYEIQVSTQEEVDLVKELISNSRLSSTSDSQIVKIINEEAEPYFAGQKSVDEVAKIIQSRVQIYLSENS